MALGQNFPVNEVYKDGIIDAETIARGGGWWTAILVIKDPQTDKPFLAFYRWQLKGEIWKTRKSITFKKKQHVEGILGAISKFISYLE